jgi:hypothetical protein
MDMRKRGGGVLRTYELHCANRVGTETPEGLGLRISCQL